MKLEKVLEKFEVMVSKWGLTKDDWFFIGEHSLKLLGYDIKARPGHLDILVNKSKLPWKVPQKIESTIPPRNSQYMQDYKVFIKKTDFGPHLLPLPLFHLNYQESLSKSFNYRLPNDKQIRIINIINQIKMRADIFLNQEIVSKWDEDKYDRWLEDFQLFERIGKEKSDDEIVKVARQTLSKIKTPSEVISIEIPQSVDYQLNQISGVTAFSNNKKIKGYARVIKDIRDLKRLKNGEILVTPMTDPSYLVVIDKAKAIITDRGGLLCHAAVISREYQIPCIIDTKIATKILRDGDYIEVNANDGIISRLNTK